MEKRDVFFDFHPIINFIYFGLVFLFTMCFWHPVSLVISFGSALLYASYLKGKKATRFAWQFILPIMLFAAVLNPAFSHKGVTILTYLPSGNPLTLESILYGLAAAGLLGAILLWFYCYNAVMSSDKFIYLFGRILPALSLVISMALRFVPKFKQQFSVVQEAQQCVDRDTFQGSILSRIKNSIRVFSIMITWSLENAIETADSMKGRGYGLPGRTAFSIYHWDARDKSILIWLLFCGIYIISGWLAGGMAWRYYPAIRGVWTGVWPWSFQLVYLCLCLTPWILNKWMDHRWASLKKSNQSMKGETYSARKS
jgi:energy-coupling factor transport system permease protein